jgi:two-component system cell cycle response regulator DivK
MREKKVLIVEDNDLNAKLFSDLLEFNGYSVFCIDNGLNLIKEIESFSPNLIIMDIQLPTVSGFDLIKMLKQDTNRFKNIPIIAITAFVFKEEVERIKAIGCEEYMAKPIDIKSFITTVKKYI